MFCKERNLFAEFKILIPEKYMLYISKSDVFNNDKKSYLNLNGINSYLSISGFQRCLF